MIIFLAVTFFKAYLLNFISTSGDLTSFLTGLLMFVAAGTIPPILRRHFSREGKKHKRTKEVIDEISYKLEARKAIEMGEAKTTESLTIEQIVDWREPEYGLREAEEKRFEDLIHLWRIDALDEMASLLVHELNQPLCAIMNYSNVCMRLMECSSDVQNKMMESMEEINLQAKRARQIIKSLKRIVTDHGPRLSAVHINNDIVYEVINIIQTEARQKNIDIQTKLAHNVPIICVDNVQILQVLLNLVRNAFDSMDCMDVDSRRLIIQTLLAKDNTIEISIRDTGAGISDDIIAKTFDTFFTTKPDGMGIGLPLCRRIIEAHGGKIWIENNPDYGVTSTFTLPLNGGRQYGELQADGICCR